MGNVPSKLFEQLLNPNMHFINEAEIYQQIIKSGYNQTELGKQIKRTQPAIGNKLRLLKLSQACRSVIIANKLKERHARALLSVRDESKRISILTYVIKHSLSVKEMEEYIASNYGSQEKAKNECNVNISEFIMSVNYGVKKLRKDIKILTKKFKKEGYTDFLIRIYKP